MTLVKFRWYHNKPANHNFPCLNGSKTILGGPSFPDHLQAVNKASNKVNLVFGLTPILTKLPRDMELQQRYQIL